MGVVIIGGMGSLLGHFWAVLRWVLRSFLAGICWELDIKRLLAMRLCWSCMLQTTGIGSYTSEKIGGHCIEKIFMFFLKSRYDQVDDNCYCGNCAVDVTGVVGDPYAMNIIVLIFSYLALAEMWNFMGGYVGLASLGQQCFVGIGGFTLAVLMQNYGQPLWLCLALSAVLCVAFAWLFGPNV